VPCSPSFHLISILLVTQALPDSGNYPSDINGSWGGTILKENITIGWLGKGDPPLYQELMSGSLMGAAMRQFYLPWLTCGTGAQGGLFGNSASRMMATAVLIRHQERP